MLHTTLVGDDQHPTQSRAPDEQAALECLYLVVRSLDPRGTGQQRWMNR